MTLLAREQRAEAATSTSKAVTIWASVGAVFLAVQAFTWISYLASGPGQITRFRDTAAPSWKWAIFMQASQIVVLAVVVVAVVRHARRRREVTFEALFLLACTALVWLDPMLNFFRPGFFYSSNFVNVESWLGHVPGQLAPYVNITPQPILWEIATYAGVFLTFVLLLATVWSRLADRFPHASAPGLFGGTLAAAMVLDLVLELPFCRTGLFAYPAASHRFSVWGGHTYQFPLVECLGASLFWTCGAALVRSRRPADGLSAVERGAERITAPRRRTAARFLAITGFLHVVFLAFPMGLAQLGPFYTDRFPTGYRADLHNGWCGPQGQPYGSCPGPGVPCQVRAGADPEPAEVYARFPYFQMTG